jgi:hypothetical protein
MGVMVAGTLEYKRTKGDTGTDGTDVQWVMV